MVTITASYGHVLGIEQFYSSRRVCMKHFIFYKLAPVTCSCDSLWCLHFLLKSTTFRQSGLYDLSYFVLYSV